MYQKQYALAIISLVVCVGCGSRTQIKPTVSDRNQHGVMQQRSAQQIVYIKVEGVECASCVRDVMAVLNKVPHVQLASFIGNNDACEQGFFSFYYPSDQLFDIDLLNDLLKKDGFVAYRV